MAYELQKSKGYFRDGLVNFNEMNISIASAPVLYGLGVYTVFYCGWDARNDQLWAFKLEEHYKRLTQSAKILSFPDFTEQYSFSQFKNLLLDMIRANKIKDNVLVRVSLFVDETLSGTKSLGLKTSLAAFIYPASPLYPASGIHVGISSWARTPDNSIPARAKVHGNYVNATLAKNEALAAGYDEAILLDNQGQVAESTVTNICIVRDGTIISPAPSTDLLEGITVRSIEQLAKHLGIPFVWRTIDRSELSIADEIFITGSSAGVTPVLSINKQPVADGKIGPLTNQIKQLYSDCREAKVEEFRNWLTPVYET